MSSKLSKWTIWLLRPCTTVAVTGRVLFVSQRSRMLMQKRPLLLKTRALEENLYKKPNIKKVGFSTMAFTAKILSWRFRQLNIVGCLLKRRLTKGGGGAPGHGHPRTPLATPLTPYEFLILNNSMLLCLTFNVIIKFSCDYMEKITEHMVDYRAWS